ncbi:hypothetical protein D3C84_1029000 [compost metagenome]
MASGSSSSANKRSNDASMAAVTEPMPTPFPTDRSRVGGRSLCASSASMRRSSLNVSPRHGCSGLATSTSELAGKSSEVARKREVSYG